jgi:hypothetical protein
MVLILILLVFALVCFAINAFPNNGIAINLDQAGKAFLVGAVIAHLF